MKQVKKLNFAPLKKVMDQIDDNGRHGRCGNWEMGLGGYDHGYGIYFRGQEIGRVNYEFGEYELYDEDFIPRDQIPEFLAALDARKFKDVGGHEGEFADDEMVSEARKQIMWAINFRNMRTAVHGMYYGKDRKRVEEFAKQLEYIQKDCLDVPSEEYPFMFDDLFADYPDIKCEEEIDWHDIVDLPGGYEGIETDDTIYRFVNRVSLDLDMVFGESTKKQKMKSKKIVNESSELQKFKRAIEAAKKSVIRDVKHHGVSENLGDSELRELRDRLFDIEHDWKNKTCSRDEELLMGKLLDDFEDWVSTYTGRDTYMEADDGKNYSGDTPKIYVGTYAKYNDGSIDGKWIDLTEYNTYDEFVDACRELHKDEKDPEFMVQDFENFPEKWYHEAGLPTEEEFDKINEYYLMDDSKKEAYEVFVNYTGLDSIEDFEEAYEGQFDSPEDFGYYCVDNFGIPDNPEYYIDYEAFGRDLTMDWHQGDPDNTDSEGNPEDPDHYYDNDGYDEGEYESDTQVAEDYVENIGGVDQLGQETMQNYFDYEAYGRDLLISDYFEEDGYIFRRY